MKNLLSKALVPLVVMASVVLAPIAVGTASAAYGPGTCTAPTVTVSPATVGRGQTFTVSISGTCANVTFTIQVHSATDTLGTLTTNSAGSASGSFTMPTNIADGSHTITVTSSFGTTGSSPITVSGGAAFTGAGSGSSSSGLPLTGSNAEATAAIGAGAVLLGGLLVMAVRRRRVVQFQ